MELVELFQTGTGWQARVLHSRVGEILVDLPAGPSPTDDQIITAVRSLYPEPIRLVRSTTLADRIEKVAELAQARQALLACAADQAFTAQERTRLSTAADLITQRIKSFV